ncbi:hypothetical protein F4861DRAFT_240642 [Xylaria intraflava]|nr:hypothetical protein F4861DRAFT_240642 [Xylaria intraflava]
MPHIGAAMERSLQDRDWKDAFVSLISRSAVAALGNRQLPRDISGDITDAKTAFSSWDNCFQAAICKWPVIALFIVGGLIIFSIVWCIIRCCCCGLSCCCQCCYCLKCCGECCGMCDPPRGKRNKYLDDSYAPANYDQAYRSPAPMQHGLDSMKPTVPQYAEFDTGAKNADALPAMPSWEGASSKKVLIEDDSVEMETLKKPNLPQNLSDTGVPHPTSPPATSPHAMSPYGPPGGAMNSNGYMAPGQNKGDAYGMNHQGYNEYDSRGYGHVDPAEGMNNMVGVATAGPLGRRTPLGDYNTSYDQGNTNQGYSQYPQSRSPRPYNDEYGRSATPASYTNRQYRGVAANDGYGNDRRSPGPQAGYGSDRRSPGPQVGYGPGNPPRMGSPGARAGYGYGNARGSPAPQAGYGLPQRSPTQNEYTQQYPVASQQEYSSESHDDFAHPSPVRHFDPPQSPIRNNSGFDFNSGYSRPSSARASPSPAPNPSANTGAAYPGHRTYKPAQDAQQKYI